VASFSDSEGETECVEQQETRVKTDKISSPFKSWRSDAPTDCGTLSANSAYRSQQAVVQSLTHHGINLKNQDAKQRSASSFSLNNEDERSAGQSTLTCGILDFLMTRLQ
jgi:hypothetical protein